MLPSLDALGRNASDEGLAGAPLLPPSPARTHLHPLSRQEEGVCAVADGPSISCSRRRRRGCGRCRLCARLLLDLFDRTRDRPAVVGRRSRAQSRTDPMAGRERWGKGRRWGQRRSGRRTHDRRRRKGGLGPVPSRVGRPDRRRSGRLPAGPGRRLGRAPASDQRRRRRRTTGRRGFHGGSWVIFGGRDGRAKGRCWPASFETATAAGGPEARRAQDGWRQ